MILNNVSPLIDEPAVLQFEAHSQAMSSDLGSDRSNPSYQFEGMRFSIENILV